jgi:hypothetical protein
VLVFRIFFEKNDVDLDHCDDSVRCRLTRLRTLLPA